MEFESSRARDGMCQSDGKHAALGGVIDMSGEKISYVPIRRVVAGNDAHGRSVVIYDGAATKHREHLLRRSTLIWATRETPANFLDIEDAGQWELGTPPPPGGTRFCVIESLPGASYPALHRTDTIDYVICLSGEITLDLDDSSVVLKAGEIAIQLGANHGWRNHTEELAVVAFVLVDGKPKSSPDLPPPRT